MAGFGFGKPYNADLTAPQSSNTVNQNAILILQQRAQHDGDRSKLDRLVSH